MKRIDQNRKILMYTLLFATNLLIFHPGNASATIYSVDAFQHTVSTINSNTAAVLNSIATPEPDARGSDSFNPC